MFKNILSIAAGTALLLFAATDIAGAEDARHAEQRARSPRLGDQARRPRHASCAHPGAQRVA